MLDVLLDFRKELAKYSRTAPQVRLSLFVSIILQKIILPCCMLAQKDIATTLQPLSMLCSIIFQVCYMW